MPTRRNKLAPEDTTMTNPVGWSSIYPPQYMSNQDPNVATVIPPELLEPGAAFGNRLLGNRGPVTTATAGAAVQKFRDMVDTGMNVAGAVGPVGIRAFHGSPHTFDSFDISKIGTGEGAQAYGHGLYFAGNEGVARGYRDALSSGQKGLKAAGDAPEDIAARIGAISQRVRTDGSFDDVLQRLASERDYHINQAQKVYEGDVVPKGADLIAGQSQHNASRAQDDIDFLLHHEKYLAPWRGSMYDVNLRTSPERLLDWDAPLGSQPAALQEKLKGFHEGELGSSASGASGADFLRTLADRTGGQAQASEHLRRAGIDGIQYLDAGSRAAGDGTRNYVMFDHELVDILRRYGLLGMVGGGAAAGANKLNGAGTNGD